jgi:hypothetical protein
MMHHARYDDQPGRSNCECAAPAGLDQPGMWIIALVWMGTACILNARRCGRTHCRYTGPYYLAMIAPVLVLASGIISVDFYAWLSLAVLILGGSTIIWWAENSRRTIDASARRTMSVQSPRATAGAIVGAPDRTVNPGRTAGPGGSVIDINVGAVRMSCHAQLAHLVDETAAFDFTEVFGWSF